MAGSGYREERPAPGPEDEGEGASWSRRSATPWSSAPGRTGSWPPTPSPTPAGTSSLVEAQDEVGGAVRSAEVRRTRVRHRPVQRLLPARRRQPGHPRPPPRASTGSPGARAPDVLAHALPDGRAAVLRGSAADTAAGLDACAAGDGDAWLRMVGGLGPHPRPVARRPVHALPAGAPGDAAAATLGASRARSTSPGWRCCRCAASARSSSAARRPGSCSSGNAMHSDVSPDSAGSALFGWLLAMLGQDVGFPVPRGRRRACSPTALRRRAESLGAQVRCGVPVTAVEVAAGRAIGVRLADGTTVPGAARRARRRARARRSTGTSSPRGTCRPGCSTTSRRFEWDDATLKVNWALDAPIPWTAPGARGGGHGPPRRRPRRSRRRRRRPRGRSDAALTPSSSSAR